MQSSNPLIAVGISAALAIGSATAATAQTEPAASAAINSSKEGRTTAISSPRSEKQEHNVLTQLPRDLLRELREAQREEENTDRSADDEREEEGQNRELAQDSSESDTTEPGVAEPVEGEPTSSEEPTADTLEPDEPDETAETDDDAADASQPESAITESTEPEAVDAIEPSQDSALEESEESTETDETNEAEADRNEIEAAQEDESVEEEPEQPETTDEPESTPEITPEAQLDDSETTDSETDDSETSNDEDLESPAEATSDDSEDEDPNVTTPVPNTSEPAPEYLDPDPNPLSFPTQPEEVEIVGTQPLTLAQAIDLAIRNNTEVQQTRLELQRAQAALRESEAANYPTVDVEANLGFSGQESPDTQQTINPVTGQFESTTDGTELSTSLALGGSVSVNYDIYTSGRRSAIIEASERQVRLQELEVESLVEDLILQITNDYYALQEADEQVQIFQAAVDEAERSLRDAEALERAGVGTRFDVLQAQVDLANAVQDLTNQQSQQEIARRQLAERLNLSQSVTLAAAEPVEVAGVWELDLEETIVQAFQNRAELQQALVRREIAERNRRAALAQLGPQVGVGASYGLNNTLASDPDSAAEDVGFLSNFQVQLGVSLRVFDGGQARAQARQAEADIAIAETEFANTRDQVRFEVEQAFSQLQSNFENIQTTALAVQQAAEALRLARLRFQAGVGTQTDVLRSQTALTQARFNNLRAILDYNRALASLQRSVSNLPEGFLNEVP